MLNVSRKDFTRITLIDDDPDLSWLDQFRDSQDEEEQKYYIADQKRKHEYGRSWSMICIQATIEVLVPFGDGGNCIVHNVTSPGLRGIEDDSSPGYLEEVFQEECEILAGMLLELGVKVGSETP